MFERLTDHVRRALVLAQHEAALLKHHEIGTEHILLGILWMEDDPAALLLTARGVSLDAVRARVVELIGEGIHPHDGYLKFTVRGAKVLEAAFNEMMMFENENNVNTRMLLLGLLREESGLAAQILVESGVELDELRCAIRMVDSQIVAVIKRLLEQGNYNAAVRTAQQTLAGAKENVKLLEDVLSDAIAKSTKVQCV